MKLNLIYSFITSCLFSVLLVVTLLSNTVDAEIQPIAKLDHDGVNIKRDFVWGWRSGLIFTEYIYADIPIAVSHAPYRITIEYRPKGTHDVPIIIHDEYYTGLEPFVGLIQTESVTDANRVIYTYYEVYVTLRIYGGPGGKLLDMDSGVFFVPWSQGQ